MSPRAAVLKTIALRKVYKTGSLDVPALQGIDLEIKAGEFVSIMGPSGCGKTTLLQILGGLSSPTSGQVFIDGVDLAAVSDAQLTRLRCLQLGFVIPHDTPQLEKRWATTHVPPLLKRARLYSQKFRGFGLP